jgi:undecaprenyl-diphosphatase
MFIIEILKAVLLGVVEGITEWLPISSTGHMILVDEFVKMNISDAVLEMFLVVIQLGAIMAVVILYFNKLNPFSYVKTPEERKSTWRLWGMVAIGCIPAAIVGLALDDWADEHLFNAYVVSAALIIYGIAFIVIEHFNRKKRAHFGASVSSRPVYKHSISFARNEADVDAAMFKVTSVDNIDWKTALKIGLFQCLAIVPGTSRSGSTIIGGMLFGCSRTAATEFTFFLAIPVMFGWSLLKVVKFIMAGIAMNALEVAVLVTGVVVAFVMSIVSIKFLLGYIKKNDFTAFGVYRIVIGVVVLGYFALKAIL